MRCRASFVLQSVLCVLVVLAFSSVSLAGYVSPDDTLLPPRFESGEIDGSTYTYDGLDRRIRTDNQNVTGPKIPPPDPGFPAESFFDVFYEIEISLDDGISWEWWMGPSTMRVGLNTIYDDGIFQMVEVELLELEIVNPANPDQRLRESPGLPSTGLTAIGQLPTGDFAIDSFFDVYYELTLDGGQTWELPIGAPGSGRHRITAIPEPSMLSLLAVGALGLLVFKRRRHPF